MNTGKPSKSQWVILGQYSQSQTGRTPTLVSHEETRGGLQNECEIRPLDIPKQPNKLALPLTYLCHLCHQATMGMSFVFHEVRSCIIRGVIPFLEKSLVPLHEQSSAPLLPSSSTFSSASSISCPSFSVRSQLYFSPTCISLPVPSDYHTVHSTFELEGLSRKKKGGGQLVHLFWMSFIPKSLSKSVISSFIGGPSKKGDTKICGQDIM